jgi:DNA-3-methyladenine glycosylase
MYHCFNIVTEKENNSCAVLIRALEPISPIDKGGWGVLNGPAKLCRELQIDKNLNGHDLTLGKKLWIENGEKIKLSQIKKAKRIGVDYARIWKNRLLRFYIKDNGFISKT